MSEQDSVTPPTIPSSLFDFSEEQYPDDVFAMSPEEWETAVSEVRAARLGVITPAYLQSIQFGTDKPLRLGETQAKAVLEALQAQGIVSKEEQQGVGFAVLPETEQPAKPGRLRALGRAALKAVPGEVRKQTKEYTAVRAHTVTNGTQATVHGAAKSARFVSGSTHRDKKRDAREQAAKQTEDDWRWHSERQTHIVLDDNARLATMPVQTAEEREQATRAALEAAHGNRTRREEIRDKDIELKEMEQAIRARELEQRERALQIRDEALARGEIIDVTPPERNDHPKPGRDSDAIQDYLKRKARWDEQTEIINKYKQQDEFADLFDEDKLRNLDAAIQADVAPLFDAALRTRIAELNKTLPDDKKWKAVDEMTKEEREKAGQKVLSGAERGSIVNPVDDSHTRKHLGARAGNHELVLAVSWQRRRVIGRSHEPQKPKNTKG